MFSYFRSFLLVTSIALSGLAAAAETTAFDLQNTDSPENRVLLRFISTDPELELNREAPLKIELDTEGPIELGVSTIKTPQWPKEKNQLSIPYKTTGKEAKKRISGRARYVTCHKVTKVCAMETSKFSLELD